MSTLFFDPVSISPTIPQVASAWRPVITVILCPEIDAEPHTITLAESVQLPGLLCLDETSAPRLRNLHHDLTHTMSGDYGGMLLARRSIEGRINSARVDFTDAVKYQQSLADYARSGKSRQPKVAVERRQAIIDKLTAMRSGAEKSWAEFAAWIESDEASAMGLRSDDASRIIKQMDCGDVI